MPGPDVDRWELLPRDFDDRFLRDGVVGLLARDREWRELDVLRGLWERNHPADVDPGAEPVIPRVLHQIWIGGPLPETYRRWREGWMEHHPDWEHRLWTDAEVHALDFGTRDLYEGTDSVGMKVDLLRMEILARFGGVYVDADYQCFASLDRMSRAYEFFGTARSLAGSYLCLPHMAGPVTICNSLVGSVPGHPILTRYLAKVRRIWRQRSRLPVTWYETRIARLGGYDIQSIKETINVTYAPFHSGTFRYLEAHPDGRHVVFPPSVLNPVDMTWNRLRFTMPLYWRALVRGLLRWGFRRPAHYVEVLPHSLGHHAGDTVWAV